MDGPADLSKVRTYALADRRSKVGVAQFARPIDVNASAADFIDSLSKLLGAEQLRGLAAAVVRARNASRPVIWAVGGHVVKAGVSPVLIEMMRRGRMTGVAMNGATAIHDWEIAAVGKTSEDVEAGLGEGRFGMAEETGRELNEAASEAAATGKGFGEVLGRRIAESELPYRDVSLLAEAHRHGLSATVHVAIGCDIVHQHPLADGAAIGAATFHDFRRLITVVRGISDGVWINCGSAVLLPEVFLKALSVAANLGSPAERLTTADLDMQRHYRTDQNVLGRPTRAASGQSFRLLGHHEINVPLLALAIEKAAQGA